MQINLSILKFIGENFNLGIIEICLIKDVFCIQQLCLNTLKLVYNNNKKKQTKTY